jgi:hypothetical protein
LCKKIDTDFHCRKVFRCDLVNGICPLTIARDVQFLVNEKNLDIADAYRCVLREGIEHDLGQSIIEDIFGMPLAKIQELIKKEKKEANAVIRN